MIKLLTPELRSIQRQPRRTVFKVGNHDGNTWHEEDASCTSGAFDIEPSRFPLVQNRGDLNLQFREILIWIQIDLVRSVEQFLSQITSPSVGGAPVGAVGGTSESTEGDQSPGVPEKKEHPAAATAGCDETKHSYGK